MADIDIRVVKRAKDGHTHVRIYRDGQLWRDYIIRHGDYYYPSTDNRSDRWYAVWLEDNLIRGLGHAGYETKTDAIGWTVADERVSAEEGGPT